MRRIIAIFFCILYLTSTTEASQLFKIPVIIQHYQEHRQADKQMSFLSFLDMHYMHGSPHDDDYDRDMQLPFKKMDHRPNFSPVSAPVFTEIVPVNTQEHFSPSFVIYNDRNLYSQYLHAIFQPPRL